MKNIYKLKTQICLFLLVSTTSLNALVSNTYSFAQNIGSMSPLLGPNILGNSGNDDTPFNGLTIPWSFHYNGANYTTFSVSPNGFIEFAATIPVTAPAANVIASSTANVNNIIAAFSNDLKGKLTSTQTSQLSWNVTLATPNRILTIEWLHYRKSNFALTSDEYNFQIQLYETSNIIKIVYGNMHNDSIATDAQVGLKGASNADFNIRTVTNNWSGSTLGGTNAATCALTSTVSPTTGQTYIWTPTSVGIANIAQPAFEVNVYPNPANLTVKISIPNANYEKLNIAIVDIQGREVYVSDETYVYGEFRKEISTEKLAKGVYYIKLNSGKDVSNHKLIIN